VLNGKKCICWYLSIIELTYNLNVLRKSRRLEKTATTSFILSTRTVDTMRRVVRVTHARERKYTYRALTGKPDSKRPSTTPRRRRKDDIKTDLNPFQPKLILVHTNVTGTCFRACKTCKNWPLCSYVG